MPSQLKTAGFALVGAGAVLGLVVFLHPEGLNAPAWVAYLAAAVFVLAGAGSLARAYQRVRVAEGLYCLVLGAFAALGSWVAFGPGVRRCTGGLPGIAFLSPEVMCRAAFGVGALVVVGMLAVALRGWFRHRRTTGI